MALQMSEFVSLSKISIWNQETVPGKFLNKNMQILIVIVSSIVAQWKNTINNWLALVKFDIFGLGLIGLDFIL